MAIADVENLFGILVLSSTLSVGEDSSRWKDRRGISWACTVLTLRASSTFEMLCGLLFELWGYFLTFLTGKLSPNAPGFRLSSSDPLVVRLPTGAYRRVAHSPPIIENGSTPSLGHPLVEKWLGIPYAMPPTGNLRFRAPRPLSTDLSGVELAEIHDATSFGAACPQPPYGDNNLGAPMSEDCLYLNVSHEGADTRNMRYVRTHL